MWFGATTKGIEIIDFIFATAQFCFYICHLKNGEVALAATTYNLAR